MVCATDLIDHVFLLGYERPGALARRLVSFLHPVLHRIEESRLRAFDYVVVNSEWTGELLRYLYGIQPDLNIAAVDVGVFQPPSPSRPPPGSYVALPTVSLDASTQALALDLHRRGIPFVAFGPHPVAGIPDRGFVTDAELVILLGQAAATLFLFDYEALGLLPFESLATGTPVITLPKGGPYSELRSNPFVSFGTDADSLFVACRRWLGNTKSAESIADCRASVLRYDPARVAEQIVELLVRRKVGSRSSSAHPRPATAAGVTQH